MVLALFGYLTWHSSRCNEELSNEKGCTKKLRVKLPSIDPTTGERIEIAKVYEIQVKPGWKSGTKIKFSKDENFPPMTFILKEKQHSFLKRNGDDLIWNCNVSASQAEKGAKLNIPLPCGEALAVSTQDISPMKDGETMRVAGKGMPIKGGPSRGDLIINFRVSKLEEKSSSSSRN